MSVAREALTNAGRHTPGEAVRMRLGYGAGVVRNQLGEFTRTSEGSGLAGMRGRLGLADGTLESGPADGYWRVLAEIRG